MRRIGLDFDGVLHDSCSRSHAAFCQTLRDHGLPPVERDHLRAYFGSDWPRFFEEMGVPEDLRATWKDAYQSRYDHQSLGEIIDGTHELLEEVLTRHGRGGLVIITNELPERVHRFFVANGIADLENSVMSAYAGKSALLESELVTMYVGDTVGDGVACLSAKNRPQFVGVAHDASYNLPEMLHEFRRQNPEHPIEVVNNLHEVRKYLR